ncbi:type II toxin-antitoxin system HicA family toxin [Pseudomonadota bacterium]
MRDRDVLWVIEQDGWHLVRTRGSHRQVKHDGKPGDDLAPGTCNSILKQAALKK